jgi:hypothetical protein
MERHGRSSAGGAAKLLVGTLLANPDEAVRLY